MACTLTPNLKSIPQFQADLWPELFPTKDLGFVLYGDTAIALLLGHRLAGNFDFYTEKSLDKHALHDNFSFMARCSFIQDQTNLISISVPCGDNEKVNISFFGKMTIGRYSKFDITDDGVLTIAALDDLLATKLNLILQRVNVKDYQDVAAMIRAGTNLERGLAIAQKMYGSSFQPSESLKSITYFKGGKLTALTLADRKTLIEAVRDVRGLPGVEKVSSELGYQNHRLVKPDYIEY